MDGIEEDFCQWAEIYVLGGLDEDERQQFEKHLAGCADCQEQVEELKKLIDLLPLAADQVTPPAGMRSRVLAKVLAVEQPEKGRAAGGSAGVGAGAGVGARAGVRAGVGTPVKPLQTSQTAQTAQPLRAPLAPSPSIPLPAPPAKLYTVPVKRSKLLRTVCASLAVVAAALAIYTAALQQDVSGLRQELAQSAKAMSGLQEQLALAGAPSRELKVSEVVQLGPAAQDIVAQGLATIVIDAKGTHLLVQAEKLPELSGSEAFQVWLIKGDVKQSAGTFHASQGTGAMYYTFDPQGYDTVAITLEPDGQGDQPRGKPILAAKIEG